MKQVTLIRGYVRNRLIPQLRVWISTLPDTEMEALILLEGETGARTAEKIAEFVLFALGHRTPTDQLLSPEAAPVRGRPVERTVVVETLLENSPLHGTLNQYKLGCRCESCKAAKNQVQRDYRERKRAAV